MQYREHPPSELFADRIKCFWSLNNDASGVGSVEPVMPDGSPEMVFNFSDRFRYLRPDGTFQIQPRTLAAGQMSRNITIGPSGAVDLFGVKFTPAGAYAAFGFPVCEITDLITDVSDIWGADESLLYEQLAEAETFEERADLFEGFLATMSLKNGNHLPELEFAVHEIAIRRGQVKIREIVSELGWSEKRLERRFAEYVGLSPKLFARIVRFQRLLQILGREERVDLASASLECGYYDQPHMNRDFAKFAGVTPTEFLRSENKLSEVFISSD